jgi:hypothetical protein
MSTFTILSRTLYDRAHKPHWRKRLWANCEIRTTNLHRDGKEGKLLTVEPWERREYDADKVRQLERELRHKTPEHEIDISGTIAMMDPFW